MIESFNALPFQIVPSLALLDIAFALGLKLGQSVYDTLFLALSLASDAQLVTADDRFYHAVHTHFPQVCWLGAWKPA